MTSPQHTNILCFQSFLVLNPGHRSVSIGISIVSIGALVSAAGGHDIVGALTSSEEHHCRGTVVAKTARVKHPPAAE